METITAELRDSFIAGFRREACTWRCATCTRRLIMAGSGSGLRASRWTFASTALAEGVPISEVSRWLGHRSITTTVDLYGHLVPEASSRARDALDKAFGA